jgi:circadian clock protein KaiC
LEHRPDNVETGIANMDSMLGGGIPTRSQVLIAGGPGTGKTLLAFEILYRAAVNGTPCAFITLDERSENVLKNVKSTFTALKEVDKLVEKGMIVVQGEDSALKISANTESETSYSLGNLVSDAEAIVKSNNAKIAVIDSLSFLKLMLGTSILFNKMVASLVSNMRRLGVTAIFTTDIPYYSRKKIKFSQELLLFDGLLALYNFDSSDKPKLEMEVIKMRGSNHYRKLSHYEITQAGITLE